MDQQNKHKPVKLYFEQNVPDDYNPNLSPIVFVHGVCTLHTTWSGVWKRIADETQRKVFSLDLRNHGKSEWSDFFSLEILVEDLENFLITNGIKKCVLVSHSLGGRISMLLALRKPEFVEKLVVEESSLRNPTPEEKQLVLTMFSLLKRIYLLPKCMTELQARKLFSSMVAERFPGPTYSSLAFYIPLRKDSNGSFSFEFNVTSLERSVKDDAYDTDFQLCQKFFGPALFIYSEASATNLEEDKSVPEYFPKAEFCKFNFIGHVLHVDCLNEFIEKVSKFTNG